MINIRDLVNKKSFDLYCVSADKKIIRYTDCFIERFIDSEEKQEFSIIGYTRYNSWDNKIEEEKHSAQLHSQMQLKGLHTNKDIFKIDYYYYTLEEAIKSIIGDDYEELTITKEY
jgi:hypothetical protein